MYQYFFIYGDKYTLIILDTNSREDTSMEKIVIFCIIFKFFYKFKTVLKLKNTYFERFLSIYYIHTTVLLRSKHRYTFTSVHLYVF